LAEYHAKWGFTPKVLQSFSDTGILMHPGPINHGVEFDSRVLYDRRSRVLEQVQNGVVIRAAILSRILGLEV
jgi:aspartate carbamoyltransferase catalytic subunit